jgi:pyruvate dehydrogenase E1 component
MNLSPVTDDLAANTAPLYGDPQLDALATIERRVLWLATSIIHHANRVRPNLSGIKVGGHQASSASIA